jgi:hypothetical protein
VHVALVCGYGTTADVSLRAFVARVARRLAELNADVIVLSGGRTGVSPETEARLLRSLLGSSVGAADVLLEERALTTLDNLAFARDLLLPYVVHERAHVRLTVFCDRIRQWKVRALARRLFDSARWVVRVVGIERATTLRDVLFQVPSFVIELMATGVPALADYLRHRALRRRR